MALGEVQREVIVLAGSRAQPVTLEQATPAIEQYLLNERKREILDTIFPMHLPVERDRAARATANILLEPGDVGL